jgi:tRNA(Ser,Leu) C12 N-acetylase TAN1
VRDWNVVVSIYQDGFRRAIHALEKLGPVERGPYHNVVVMKVEDPISLLAAIERQTEETPALYDAISRVAPAMRRFEFQSANDFREKAKPVLREWAVQLAGRSFHARLHRRGLRQELKSPDVEKFFDDEILAATGEAGAPAKLSFTDPDAVIAIDTVDDQAGMALWTREDLARHRLLRPG